MTVREILEAAGVIFVDENGEGPAGGCGRGIYGARCVPIAASARENGRRGTRSATIPSPALRLRCSTRTPRSDGRSGPWLPYGSMAATGNDRNETKAAQRPDLSAFPRSSIRTAQKRGPNRINELAEAFGVNRHTIERAIADGRLHLFLGKSEKVLAFEQRLAAFDFFRRLDQPHERHCDTVDFPDPDSPSNPSRSPARRSKLTPSTARTAPSDAWY
jgi:hypothetical protein